MSETNSRKVIDLSGSPKNFHIVGIGGAGMSAIALVLNRMGHKVSGSDLKHSHVTDRLISQGIGVAIGHDPLNIPDSNVIVIRSSAVGQDNVEIKQANTLGLETLSRAEILAAICAREKTIGVAGSHGKTTTTSMVTAIARAGGLNPSFMIGGDVNEIGTNATYNSGSYLIVEADESDKTFLSLDLVGSIVTNVEADHLENYGESFDQLRSSFETFVSNTDGPVVICIDEPNAAQLARNHPDQDKIITVGSDNADWTYEITSTKRNGISALVHRQGMGSIEVELAVPGAHNIRNALCAFAIMNQFRVSDEACLKGLASFGGVSRRFQFRGETKGITFIDDYAHLPTEIEVTLDAAKQGGFKNIIAIFQPHRYSRTAALYEDFAKALSSANTVIVTEIYSAGEEPRVGVTGSMIVESLKALNHDGVYFVPHIEDIVEFLSEEANAGDVVLTLGAGDVTMYADVIQDGMKK